jgi:hypothetical protein
MTDTPKKLSETARALLTAAAVRNDHLIRPPQLPIAAARQVIRSLLNAGLAVEVPALIEDAAYAWRTGEDGNVLVLHATRLGLARVSEDQNVHAVSAANDAPAEAARTKALRTQAPVGRRVTAQAPHDSDKPTNVPAAAQDPQGRLDGYSHCGAAAPSSPPPPDAHRTLRHAGGQQRPDNLRQAAQALLDAWDALTDSNHATLHPLSDPIAGLRTALTATGSTSASSDGSRLRKDTKQARALTMLRRDEGASGPHIAAEMGWAPHTVRGFLAGLAKKGIAVSVLERVRQIGPNTDGAKGSYTIYQINDP